METISLTADLRVTPLSEPGSRLIDLSELIGGSLDEAEVSNYHVRSSRMARGRVKTAASAPSTSIETGGDRTADAMPTAISANWTRLALAQLSSDLYSKLVRLARREDGWRGPGSKALTAEALQTFVEFWIAVRHRAVEPSVALTADGGLEVQWYKSSRKHLDLRFGGAGRVFFGLFSSKIIYEGVDMMPNVVQLLAGHVSKPLKWK